MNLLHLQYFYFVAKEGGFTRASQSLSIRQPAISRMVAQLEESFGFKLFERQGRNVILTQRGHQVFERARKIFQEVDDLQVALGHISGECSGDLKFAAAEPICSVLVPRALKDLCAKHPKIYPQVTSGPATFLADKIRGGALSFGLFFHIPDLKEGLAIAERIPLPFALVVRKVDRRNTKVLESFIGSREIDDTTTRSFPTLDVWRRLHPKAGIRISTNNVSAHKELVMEGQGIAVLPKFLIERELKNNTVVDLLPKSALSFDLNLVARETAILSLNATQFMRSLRKVLENVRSDSRK